MESLRHYADLFDEQKREIGEAEGRALKNAVPRRAQAAMVFHMSQAGLPRSMITLEYIQSKPKPLAEGHATPTLRE